MEGMTGQLHPKVKAIEPLIVGHLEDLRELFADDMRVAFVSWLPGRPEVELVCSDGELPELRDVIQRRIAADEPPDPPPHHCGNCGIEHEAGAPRS